LTEDPRDEETRAGGDQPTQRGDELPTAPIDRPPGTQETPPRGFPQVKRDDETVEASTPPPPPGSPPGYDEQPAEVGS
jgi:hypothetical protein